MATILITGGTGLIGRALVKLLEERGDQVIILTRDPSKHVSKNNVRYAAWNVQENSIDEESIRLADHIIHLAGAGVADKRWTTARKQEIESSRVLGGRLLVKSLLEVPNKVQSVIAASAIGWYGPDPQIPNPKPFPESAPHFDDFLGNTCFKWEESMHPVTEKGIRLVILRTGIVLSPEGGALKEFIRPLRFGLAAILGKGSQVISWIHLQDLVRLYLHAIQKQDWHGVYNAVAPFPVSNKTLTLILARQICGKFFLPVHIPSFGLKLVLGEMSIEVLKSTTVSAEKCRHGGFQFNYPKIEGALKAT